MNGRRGEPICSGIPKQMMQERQKHKEETKGREEEKWSSICPEILDGTQMCQDLETVVPYYMSVCGVMFDCTVMMSSVLIMHGPQHFSYFRLLL